MLRTVSEQPISQRSAMQSNSVCPICWVTALASVSMLLALSALLVAATDRWTLAAATVLGATSVMHRAGIGLVPWWLFALMTGIAVCRVAFLLVFNRERLLFVKAWGHACQIAARRCPKREAYMKDHGA
jgi:hypothetical protein